MLAFARLCPSSLSCSNNRAASFSETISTDDQVSYNASAEARQVPSFFSDHRASPIELVPVVVRVSSTQVFCCSDEETILTSSISFTHSLVHDHLPSGGVWRSEQTTPVMRSPERSVVKSGRYSVIRCVLLPSKAGSSGYHVWAPLIRKVLSL